MRLSLASKPIHPQNKTYYHNQSSNNKTNQIRYLFKQTHHHTPIFFISNNIERRLAGSLALAFGTHPWGKKGTADRPPSEEDGRSANAS